MNTSRKPPASSTSCPVNPEDSAPVEDAGQAFLRERAEMLKTATPKPLPTTYETIHESSMDDLD